MAYIFVVIYSITFSQITLKAVHSAILKDIDHACAALSSGNVAFGTILGSHRSGESLLKPGSGLMDGIIQEMFTRFGS